MLGTNATIYHQKNDGITDGFSGIVRRHTIIIV